MCAGRSEGRTGRPAQPLDASHPSMSSIAVKYASASATDRSATHDGSSKSGSPAATPAARHSLRRQYVYANDARWSRAAS
jgi:hypothetical protein